MRNTKKSLRNQVEALESLAGLSSLGEAEASRTNGGVGGKRGGKLGSGSGGIATRAGSGAVAVRRGSGAIAQRAPGSGALVARGFGG